MGYAQIIEGFLQNSLKVGKAITEDYEAAKKIFEALQKEANFYSLVEQRKGDAEAFLDEAHRFAVVIDHWAKEYPALLRDFQTVLKEVIKDLESIEGMHLKYNDQQININFNEKEFMFHWVQNHPRDEAEMFVPDSLRAEIAKEENRIVQEIAEIISLDLHLSKYLQHIQQITEDYKIPIMTDQLFNAKDINSDKFNISLHALVLWWNEINTLLKKLRKITHKAVEMDKKVTKQLTKLFAKESKKKIRETKLQIAKGGLLLLAKIALNIVPGGGLVDVLFEASQTARMAKDSLRALKEGQE